MVFIFLIFLTALTLEGMGTYISIIGLSKLFSSSIVVLLLMATLDLAKLVSVSFVYRYWKKVNFLLKSYMLIAVLVTMTITSTGAFSYLSGQFQQAYVGTQQNTTAIDSLSEEQTRLQKRKEEIDKQIAQLPPDFIRARTTLQKQFGPEVTRINERLIVIDKELPELKAHTLSTKVEVGPILFIAEAFSTTPEIAIKWIILTIIFVFDPLAVALLIAGNFLLALRAEKKEAKLKELEEKEYAKHENEDLKEALRQATKKEPEPDEPIVEPAKKEPLVTIEYELTEAAEKVIDDIYDGPNHLEFEEPIAKAEPIKKYDPDFDDQVGVDEEEILAEYLETSKPQSPVGTLTGAIEKVQELIEEKTAPDQPNYIVVKPEFLDKILHPKTEHVSDFVDTDLDLGRAGAFDTSIDEHDHLSDDEIHEQQGRAMAVDEKSDEELAREVITMDELNNSVVKPVHRSSLEDFSGGDGTFNENWLSNRKTHLAQAYDDDNSPPIVPAR